MHGCLGSDFPVRGGGIFRKNRPVIAPDRSPHHQPLPAERLARRTLIVSTIVVALAVLVIFIWYSLHVVLLIFAGILVAVFLAGLADFITEYTHLRHGWSLAIVIIGILAFFSLVGWLIAPRLGTEASELAERLPAAIAHLKEQLARSRFGATIVRAFPSAEAIASYGASVLGSVPAMLSGAFGAIVTVLVTVFIGLYMAAEPRLYVRGLLHLIPHERRDRAAEVIGAVGYTLKWWLIGQGVDMIFIGIITTIGLWLIGIPLALLIGFLAALFNFIPNFGPFFSLAPALLIALTISPGKALWVIVLYVIVQSIEGYLLQPTIQRRAVSLPAALTLTCQVLLGLLAGALGLALATPLTAAAFVAVKMLYVEDTLGDYIDNPSHGAAREEVREVQQAREEVERGVDPQEP